MPEKETLFEGDPAMQSRERIDDFKEDTPEEKRQSLEGRIKVHQLSIESMKKKDPEYYKEEIERSEKEIKFIQGKIEDLNKETRGSV
jgi:hypothetical protein